MNPALITSARPLTYSADGSDSSTARSASTPAGGWKAPTRFLPASMFTAVLPPTAASTTASRVVGTRISRTPRSQVAATNPARSVVAPPPTPTMASLRVSRCPASRDHRSAATGTVLAASPAGTSSPCTAYPAPVSTPHTGRATSPSPSGCTTTTVRADRPTSAGSSASTPVPTTTW